MLSSVFLTALPLLASTVAASSHNVRGRHPNRLASEDLEARAPAPEDGAVVSLDKRQASNARFTYYDTEVGLGACGIWHANSEYTVALNSDQLHAAGGGYPPAVCGKSISIQWGGKTISATIQDECPTCPYGGLDLSAGLFSAFASHDVGVIYGTWWYNDGSGQQTTTEAAWTPTTTSTTPAWTPTTTSTTPEWTPTTTWTPEPTTSSTPKWTPPTTTSTSWTPTTTSTSSTSIYSAPPSSSALPSNAMSWGASGSAGASGSYAASGSLSGSDAQYTLTGLSAKASSTGTTTGSSRVVTNNLEKLGSLVDMMGKTVCNGNANCEN